MSNKAVEAVKKGQNVTTEELLEVVNAYALTTLSVRASESEHETIMSMQVNQFEKLHGDYKFSQKCHGYNDAMYVIRANDLLSVDGEYNQKADAFHITCKLKNGMELWLVIVNVSGSETETDSDGFRETDVYEMQEFLDDVIHDRNKYYCIMARITDVFGFDLKIRNPIRTYINTLDGLALHISDDANTFEVPVFDDSIFQTKFKE